jgi:hypothetical protein
VSRGEAGEELYLYGHAIIIFIIAWTVAHLGTKMMCPPSTPDQVKVKRHLLLFFKKDMRRLAGPVPIYF